MITSGLLLPLVSFAVVATITPGGATTLATASGARFGFARSVPLLAGIAAGVSTLTGSVAGGLGSLLVAFPEIEIWIRVAGTAYLAWLAWRIMRLGAPGDAGDATAAPLGLAAGLALLWLNPKAWTMAVAAASTYSGIAAGPFLLALTMGAVFGGAAAISLTLWCAGGSWLSRILRTDRQWRIVNCALGAMLAASIIPMWL